MSDAPIHSTLSRPDGTNIAYRLRLGDPRRPGLVWLGGLNSDMAGTKATALDAFAAETGRTYLRFDHFAHGLTGGDFRAASISRWLADALAVLDELTQGPQILVGSSMGGHLALLAARARPTRVKGLALIAPAIDMTERLMWAQFSPDQRAALLSKGAIEVPSAYSETPYLITRLLIEDGRKHLVLDKGVAFDGPVRLFQGMADPDVPWTHALKTVDALTSRDVVVTLVKDGDHRLSTPANIAQLIALVDGLCRDVEAALS